MPGSQSSLQGCGRKLCLLLHCWAIPSALPWLFGAWRGVPNSGCVLGVILGPRQEQAASVCAVPCCRCVKWAVSDDSPGSGQGWAAWGEWHHCLWHRVELRDLKDPFHPSPVHDSIVSGVQYSLSLG